MKGECRGSPKGVKVTVHSEPKKRILLRLPESLFDQLHDMAYRQRKSLNLLCLEQLQIAADVDAESQRIQKAYREQ